MKKIIIALSLLTFSISTFANIEEDKNAGTCAMYLFIASKLKLTGSQYGPRDALALADKQERAAQYSKIYADRIKENSIKKISIEPLIREGVASCYDIGLKLSR